MSVLDRNLLRIPNPVSDLAGGVPKYVFFEGEHVDIAKLYGGGRYLLSVINQQKTSMYTINCVLGQFFRSTAVPKFRYSSCYMY
jgi:hypothetical protein